MLPAPGLAAIPLCAALNFAIGNVVYLVKLPIYLDSIGTILCALLIFPDRLAGICCAFIAGLIGVILSGLVVDPFLPWLPFSVLALALCSVVRAPARGSCGAAASCSCAARGASRRSVGWAFGCAAPEAGRITAQKDA